MRERDIHPRRSPRAVEKRIGSRSVALNPIRPEHGLTLTGLNHFDLLNHPVIYAKLRDWVAAGTDCR